MVVERPSWDEYFMSMAIMASMRSTCSRLRVGAVIVVDNQVVGTGYNGAPSGMKHCRHVDDTPCRVSVHAEANAVLHSNIPQSPYNVMMYVTHAPCYECAKLIVNKGVTHVMYATKYRSEDGLDLLEHAGVWCEQSN